MHRRLAVVREPSGPRGLPVSEYLWMTGENLDAPVVDLSPSKSHEEDMALRNALLRIGQDGEEADEPGIIDRITDAIYDMGQAISNIAWHVLIEVGGIPVNVDWLIRQVNRLPNLVGTALTQAICTVYGEVVKFYRYVRNLLAGEVSLPGGLREVELVRRQFERCQDIIQSIPAVAVRLLSRAVALVVSPAKILSRLISTAATNAAELLATTAERTWKRAADSELVMVTAERLVQVGIVATSALNIINENAMGPVIEQIDKFVEWVSVRLSRVLSDLVGAIKTMSDRTGLVELLSSVAKSVRSSVTWDTVYQATAWFTSTPFWDVVTKVVRWLMTAVAVVKSKMVEFVAYLSTAFTHWVQRTVDFLVPWDSLFYSPMPINRMFWIEQTLITGPAGRGIWDEDKRTELRLLGDRLRRLIEEGTERRIERIREIRGLENMIDSLRMVIKYSLPMARGMIRDTEFSIPAEDVERLEQITAFPISNAEPAEAEGRHYVEFWNDILTDDTPGEPDVPRPVQTIGQANGDPGTPGGVRRRRGRRPPSRALPSVTPPSGVPEEEQGPASGAVVPLTGAPPPRRRRAARASISKSVFRALKLTGTAAQDVVDQISTGVEQNIEHADQRALRMRNDPEFRRHQQLKSKWGVAFAGLALGGYGLVILWNVWSAEKSRRSNVSVEVSKWITGSRATASATQTDTFVSAWKDSGAGDFTGSLQFGYTLPPVTAGDVANWVLGTGDDYIRGLENMTTEELQKNPTVTTYTTNVGTQLIDSTRRAILKGIKKSVNDGAASLRDHLAEPPEGWTWSDFFNNSTVRLGLAYATGGASEGASWMIKSADLFTKVLGQALPIYWVYHIGMIVGTLIYAAFKEESSDARRELMNNVLKLLIKDFLGFVTAAGLGISALTQLGLGETEKAVVRGVGSITALAGGMGVPSMARRFLIGV